ncbi:hypothetical protein SBRCBS47491_004203 [Sporothrix bragantina]|uniref:DNA replication factor Cdt1 C-terminal domain-containing protein n=1 Tax=Sporothrix bragantina TaxID=671064 RepID=A0ABP0BMP3_9PEZI
MARSTRASRDAPSSAKHASSTVAQSTRSIDSFGRVSKRVASSSLKKAAIAPAPVAVTITASRQVAVERFLADKAETKEEKTETTITVQSPTAKSPKNTSSPSTTAAGSIKQRKRRAAEALDADDSSSPAPSSQAQPSLAQPSSAKRARRTAKAKTSVAELLARAAQKKEVVLPSVDSDSDSPPTSSFNSEKTGNLIARLDLNFSNSFSSSPSPPRSTSSSPRPNSTAPTTPCESENECEDIKTTSALPLELLDLLRLQTAFSKTLAVHHAHHGTNAPVDLRSFCPGVAQAWGKRRVTLEDVQRCLGVVSLSTDASIANVLFLSDYGRGKICIEMQPNATGPTSTLADQLNAVFEANLRARWVEAKTTTKPDAKQFIFALPKASVSKCASLLQSSALRTKGQRTLEELMNGIALQKQEKEAHEAMLKAPVVEAMQVDDKTETSTAVSASATPSAPMNLLDRIRFRQMQRAQLLASGDLAKPPTPEELERRAALQRAGDIAEVLSMLCTAASMRQSNRVPFGMTAIVSKIKDSLRTPIAREEAAACVRLLSKEVAPQWLQMVSMGGREIVIMMADKVPSKTEIHERVQSLVQ